MRRRATLAGIALLVLPGCSAATFDVGGTLQLDASTESVISSERECPLSHGGYADIGTGTQVTVYDASGKAVATGMVGMGVPVGDVGERTSRCHFAFSVPGVPEGSAIYAVEISHRGQVRFSRDDLRGVVSMHLGS